MSFMVYIIQCSDGTLYTGRTVDIHKRLRAHNGEVTGGAKYTRYRRPVRLVYSEEYATLSAALKREYQIKKLSRSEKKQLLRNKRGRTSPPVIKA